ncbi:type IV secretory system conjugative DNA transfer family protein, partial [Escherichia coli]|uniref:type IV secretory system conjugative DNA transfer family protein n=1 Tax=Escherichia coli TaxID=562 RepID=UPI00207B16DE
PGSLYLVVPPSDISRTKPLIRLILNQIGRRLYRDPTVAEVTSRCDWRIADLIAAEHPGSLYLVVPPSDISRTKPLIRLILNQIGRRLYR